MNPKSRQESKEIETSEDGDSQMPRKSMILDKNFDRM